MMMRYECILCECMFEGMMFRYMWDMLYECLTPLYGMACLCAFCFVQMHMYAFVSVSACKYETRLVSEPRLPLPMETILYVCQTLHRANVHIF